MNNKLSNNQLKDIKGGMIVAINRHPGRTLHTVADAFSSYVHGFLDAW